MTRRFPIEGLDTGELRIARSDSSNRMNALSEQGGESETWSGESRFSTGARGGSRAEQGFRQPHPQMG